MIHMIPKPGLSSRQKGAALAFAGFVDMLQIAVFPAFVGGVVSPFQDAVDIITAMVLVAICGFRWQFALGFMAELVPGFALFPSWTAVALTLPVLHQETPHQTVTASDPRTPPRQPQPGPRYAPIDVDAVVVPPVQAEIHAKS